MHLLTNFEFLDFRFSYLFLGGGGQHLVDATLHVEVTLGDLIEFPRENHLEATNGVLDGARIFRGRR